MSLSTQIANLLSPGELEVFTLLAQGHPAKHIATLRGKSIKTIEAQKYNLMGKLKASSTVELVHLAIAAKMVLPTVTEQTAAVLSSI